jgi:hypothetical protein
VKDDGLIHRFPMCAPKPVFLSAEDIIDAPELSCSFVLVMFYIYKFHYNEELAGKVYDISADASRAFNKYFNKNREQVADANNLHKDILLG